MKKQLLIFASLLAFTASYAEHVLPIKTMIIPVAYTSAMCIDGVDNEPCWSAEQPTVAFNTTGADGASADYTFTFKVCFDMNYLFIYGKILDEYDNSWEWGGSNQWTYDCVEIFVDLDTNGSGANSAYDSNTYQLRINRGIDSIGDDCGRPGKAFRKEHVYYWENTADGWIFEAALNWKFVLGNGQKQEDILQYMDGIVASGFDIHGADSDVDGQDNRDCQTAWDEDLPNDEADRTEDNAWNNRTVLGVITFGIYYSAENINSSDDKIHFKSQNSSNGLCSNSIPEHTAKKVNVYPNPISNVVYFENLQGKPVIEIYDIMGQVVQSSIIIDNQINISQLKSGVYFAKIGKDSFKLIKD